MAEEWGKCPVCGNASYGTTKCDDCNMAALRKHAPEIVTFIKDSTDFQIEAAAEGIILDGPIPRKNIKAEVEKAIASWLHKDEGNA